MLALRICQPCSALDFKDAEKAGFAKMSLLFCFGFQRCWEQDDRMMVFFEKTIESNKCGKVDFLQSWAKQWSYCTVIATFSCNRLTAI